MTEEKTTEIRPYKWSSWGVEIYVRERAGKTEYAYFVEEQKWTTIEVEGDYTLVPVVQNKKLAPLFANPDDTTDTDMIFVVEGITSDEWSDGGYLSVDFGTQPTSMNLKAEYATLEKRYEPLERSETEILGEMGFEPDEDIYRHVLKFNQRRQGE